MSGYGDNYSSNNPKDGVWLKKTICGLVLKSTSIKNEFKNDLLSHDLPPAIPISIKKG